MEQEKVTIEELNNNIPELARLVLLNNAKAVYANMSAVMKQSVHDVDTALNVLSELIREDDTETYEKILTVPYVMGKDVEVDRVYAEARLLVEDKVKGQKFLPLIVASLFGVVTTAGNIPGMNPVMQTPAPTPPTTFFEDNKSLIIGGGVFLLLVVIIVAISKAKK